MGNMYLWVLCTWDREETGNVHLTEKKNDYHSKINGSSSLKDFLKPVKSWNGLQNPQNYYQINTAE